MLAPTIDSIRTLIAHEEEPCISIYLPTHRGGSADDRAHLAGKLREVRAQLQQDHPRHVVDGLMTPLESLGGGEFWAQSAEGLAIFRSRILSVHWHLPTPMPDRVVIAPSFHLRPLLRFVQSNQHWWLVVLTHDRVALLKGSATGLIQAAMPTLPRSYAAVAAERERERTHGMHSAGRTATVHHGGAQNHAKAEDEARFVRAVDRALRDVLRDESAPILLAGPDRLTHQLRALVPIDGYGPAEALGNVAHETLSELHARGWPVAQRILEEKEARVAERWNNLVGRGRALDELATIARVAVQGRVRDLMVAADAVAWGRMDPVSGAVELHDRGRVGHEDDLYDEVAEAVLLRGGEVHTLQRSRMPSASPVAATLRW